MKVYIAGTGMDGKNTLTRECEKAVESADILIGARRMLEPFASSGKECFCTYDTDEIVRRINEEPEKNITVLMSGDCGFYSGAKKLSEMLGERTEIISGISSPVYFCSKTGLSWENMKFISLHGKDDNAAVYVKLNRYCFFLLGGKTAPADICRKLCQYGMKDVRVCIGENLGYDSEKITKGTAAELSGYQSEKLCVMTAENPDHLAYIPCGIADDEFIRTTVPMTKSEIRSAAVSKLNICSSDICLDAGCGTGSVSVEMAYRCPEGRVYGCDIKQEAAELTLKNSMKFGCDNISAETGDTAEYLKDHKELIFDKAFIGGSGGRLGEIIGLLYERNPKVRTVITAVTLETLNSAVKELENAGAEISVTQISVTRTRKAGRSTMFDALNPVFIIEGARP